MHVVSGCPGSRHIHLSPSAALQRALSSPLCWHKAVLPRKLPLLLLLVLQELDIRMCSDPHWEPGGLQLGHLTSLTKLHGSNFFQPQEQDTLPPNLQSLNIGTGHSCVPSLLPLTQLHLSLFDCQLPASEWEPISQALCKLEGLELEYRISRLQDAHSTDAAATAVVGALPALHAFVLSARGQQGSLLANTVDKLSSFLTLTQPLTQLSLGWRTLV